MDVEHEKVNMVRHDAEAENAPVLTVKATDLAGHNVGARRVREDLTPRGSTCGEKRDRSGLGVDRLIETDRFSARFLRWHGSRISGGPILGMMPFHSGGGKPLPYEGVLRILGRGYSSRTPVSCNDAVFNPRSAAPPCTRRDRSHDRWRSACSGRRPFARRYGTPARARRRHHR